MSEMSEKISKVEAKVEELAEEIEGIYRTLYDLAQEAASHSGKIRTESVDWAAVDQVDREYEVWYNQALTLVSEYLPSRQKDFKKVYAEMDNYIHFDEKEYEKADRYCGFLRRLVSKQKNILLSIPPKLEAERLKTRKEISDDIVSEELYQAKTLYDSDHTRAAGVVAGIALERHLLTLCEVSEQELDYNHSDGVRSLAETLYQAGEITDTKKSQLGYLSDIRNDCAHANEQDPDRSEVERLIQQSEDIHRAV